MYYKLIEKLNETLIEMVKLKFKIHCIPNTNLIMCKFLLILYKKTKTPS